MSLIKKMFSSKQKINTLIKKEIFWISIIFYSINHVSNKKDMLLSKQITQIRK